MISFSSWRFKTIQLAYPGRRQFRLNTPLLYSRLYIKLGCLWIWTPFTKFIGHTDANQVLRKSLLVLQPKTK